ncbi:MAG: tRNA lysidine(34) synthetase TilS, partial [Kiritimatiellia bacterium]|nr:tRNA lysidine(34) synthetase TilS [Kiritimatiellia bacterium]
FFKQQGDVLGISTLALAHTADDQAETVLLRLARGVGPRGLGGMAWTCSRDGLTLVRPFLGLRAADLRAFLRAHGLTWREDESNRDDRFLRVRVRNEILPMMEKRLNPAVCEAIGRATALLRDESRALDAIAREAARPCALGAGLRVVPLRSLQPAIRRRILLAWLEDRWVEHFGSGEGVGATSAVVERLDHLGGTGRGRVPIHGKLCAEIRAGVLMAREISEKDRMTLDLPIPESGDLALPGDLVFRITGAVGFEKNREAGPGIWPATAWIRRPVPGDKPFRVRYWRAGDRYRPFGAPGSRKVQDIFSDTGVPRDRRGAIPILVSGPEIVWLPGYRVAHGWAVGSPGELSLRLRIESEAD